MIRIIFMMVIFGLTLPHQVPAADPGAIELQDLRSRRTIPLAELAPALAADRIVLVGEHHTAAAHHRAQLAVISALADAGRKVAVGMEMFHSDSQPHLDAWVAGRLGESEFETVYRENWNYPWPLYRPILDYARQNGLPVIGLNVPREITRQVAYKGFAALPEKDRRDLPFVTCDVDADYMAYIRQAYGAHGHGQMNFTHFCEAQLVWDKSMAANALRFLEANPDYSIVVLAGSGHARKGGIPAQLKKMTSLAHAVILPEAAGSQDRPTLGPEDADYIIRGF